MQAQASRPSLYPGGNSRKKKYDSSKNVSKFAPKKQSMEPETEVIKSYTPYVQAFKPGKSFGRSIPKPVLKTGDSNDKSELTRLASADFRENLKFSSKKMFNNPGEMEKSVVRSYASISGGDKLGNRTESGNIEIGSKVSNTLSGKSVMPIDSFRNAPVGLKNIFGLGDEGGSQAMGGPADNAPTGFEANTFSAAYKQEAWVQYSGLIQDNLAVLESFIRAKAGTVESTLMVKMSNGRSPGGSPSAFQASVSGSISARIWKEDTGRAVNLVPGKDFTVQAHAIPGIAELHVPKKEHRDWLVGQYRFPYLKLSIDGGGKVINHGQEGTFYITQLTKPLQLYDIWGVDKEHFQKFDGPIEKEFKDVFPEVPFNLINVKANVPAFNPEDNTWGTTSVPSHKRVALEVPPNSDLCLPNGFMLLNIQGVGERVVYTQRVLAVPECPYCGGNCPKGGCRNRCKWCGIAFVEGHFEDNCEHKAKGEVFYDSNLWIEKTTRQALQYRTNLLSYSMGTEEKHEIIKKRLDRKAIEEAVLDTQARIMSTALLPLELRQDFEARAFDRDDVLVPSEASSAATRKSAMNRNTAQARLGQVDRNHVSDNDLIEANNALGRSVGEPEQPAVETENQGCNQEDAQPPSDDAENLGETVELEATPTVTEETHNTSSDQVKVSLIPGKLSSDIGSSGQSDDSEDGVFDDTTPVVIKPNSNRKHKLSIESDTARCTKSPKPSIFDQITQDTKPFLDQIENSVEISTTRGGSTSYDAWTESLSDESVMDSHTEAGPKVVVEKIEQLDMTELTMEGVDGAGSSEDEATKDRKLIQMLAPGNS